MKNSFLSLGFLLLSFTAISQDIAYAKDVLKQLTSPEFFGRGYVNKGEKIAADFIRSEFESIGLQSYKKGYFQSFDMSANTFPSTMELVVNGNPKIAGVDYLIDAGSPTISGQFETVYLAPDDILSQEKLVQILRSSAGKFIVIPNYDKRTFSKDQQKQITELINFLKYHPDNPAKGSILLTDQKLTWGGSTVQNPKPTFILKSDSTMETIEQISVNVKAEFFKEYPTQNVVGYIEGEQSDSLIVMTAHYDHLGMMGSDALFPGANDNASGIALILNMAKHYQSNPPKYRTVFIAFAGEELGLLGSWHFVENPLFELSKIKFLINFDLSGTGDDGIQVVNGKVHRKQFDRLVQINEKYQLMTQVKIRGEACNSDHCMFHMQDVPCFFIYTLGGIQAYHDIYDKSETLPLTEYEDYFTLMVKFFDGL